MLADGVEAAVRASRDHSPDVIERIVREIIGARSPMARLNECDLTLRDLDKIREAFWRRPAGRLPPAASQLSAPCRASGAAVLQADAVRAALSLAATHTPARGVRPLAPSRAAQETAKRRCTRVRRAASVLIIECIPTSHPISTRRTCSSLPTPSWPARASAALQRSACSSPMTRASRAINREYRSRGRSHRCAFLLDCCPPPTSPSSRRPGGVSSWRHRHLL